MLIFTLEHARGDAPPDYRLELHGRYAHARAYVERLLAGAGLTAEIAEAALENGIGSAGGRPRRARDEAFR